MKKRLLLSAILSLFFIAGTFGQVLIKSVTTPYIQNFNTLKTSGTSNKLPTGWKLLESGTGANTYYAANSGTSSTGDTYSYGTGTNSDRALGTLRFSTFAPVIGVQFKNTTGKTLTTLKVSYVGEQWRCGATGRQDQFDFQYSLDATSLSSVKWIDVNELDFKSPSVTIMGAKDGNASVNRNSLSATLTGLSIPNNSTFWLRWTDLDAAYGDGSDDGLAVDDFSLLATGDVIPPVLAGFSPANSAVDVPVSGNLVATFSENIVKGTGNIVFKKISDGTVVLSKSVTDATITVNNTAATIPYTGLSSGTTYYVEMPAGIFKDLSGNSFAGISGPSAWSFTTILLPSVSVDPPSLDFGFTAAGGSSASQTFSFTAANLTGDLTLTAPEGFKLSRGNSEFSGSLIYLPADYATIQLVYVTFNPSAEKTYSGSVRFSGTGLNETKVQLSGTSSTLNEKDTLRVVNWNIEYFGSTSGGPIDDNLQEQNVKTVMQKINADIYGFVEIVSTSRLQNIVNQLPGYSLLVSNFCSSGTTATACSSDQKLAFVYRTPVISKLRAYPVLYYGGSANADYNWSSGRFPYLMEADVTANGTTQRVQFVVIHAKANTSDYVESYNRRKAGAQELHDSLMVQYPSSNWVVLGDYNDDLDKTITTQVFPVTTTSYVSFVSEPAFNPVTLPLSLAGLKSTVDYSDVIDHVTISDDMARFYVANSARILRSEVETWIANYGNTTSDHYPVLTKFVFENAAPLALKSAVVASTDRQVEYPMQCRYVSLPGHLDVYITQSEQLPTHVQLIDLSGSIRYQEQIRSMKGTVKVSIGTSDLAGRICLVRVFNSKGTNVGKVSIR